MGWDVNFLGALVGDLVVGAGTTGEGVGGQVTFLMGAFVGDGVASGIGAGDGGRVLGAFVGAFVGVLVGT